ncbi:unnamed protein product [Lota lota]
MLEHLSSPPAISQLQHFLLLRPVCPPRSTELLLLGELADDLYNALGLHPTLTQLIILLRKDRLNKRSRTGAGRHEAHVQRSAFSVQRSAFSVQRSAELHSVSIRNGSSTRFHATLCRLPAPAVHLVYGNGKSFCAKVATESEKASGESRYVFFVYRPLTVISVQIFHRLFAENH